MEEQYHVPSAIYNLGTGKARSFNDLVKSTYAAMGKDPVIEYIDMPEDIRDTYQYFTEATMNKLSKAGYTEPFYTLEAGIMDYVKHYLLARRYY
jgi:ADP-L-glycero-D-manno-heptose 6-epimerase